ncbi:MAG: BrnT family toxin [Terracidiphilus sp.]
MPKLQFEWDRANITHIAEHGVRPEEAEQVILNRPVDLGSELRNGEERTAQVGETDAGRILIAISTMLGTKIRVITAWPAKKRLRRYFLAQKGNGNVGRIEEKDLRE